MTPVNAKHAIAMAICGFERTEYGWDGESALPIRPDVKEMLDEAVVGQYQRDLDGLPIPKVSMEADGTVEIQFIAENKALFLYYVCKGVVHYLKVFGDSRAEECGIIRTEWLSGMDELSGMLAWMKGA